VKKSVRLAVNHKIIERFGLEGTFKGHLVQHPCSEQGHLQQDQVAQSPVQPDLECFQGWGIYHLSGQLVPLFRCQYRLGDEEIDSSPAEKDLGVIADEKMDMTQTCACSPEGQPYPGLHQKQRGQQGKGGDSAPLLHSGVTPPGVLRPAPEPSAQARHRPDGVCPKEGHKNYQKTLVPLPGGKAERLGVVQPGEEEALGRPYYVGNYIFTSFFYMSR